MRWHSPLGAARCTLGTTVYTRRLDRDRRLAIEACSVAASVQPVVQAAGYRACVTIGWAMPETHLATASCAVAL